jgi:hypothetical protein
VAAIIKYFEKISPYYHKAHKKSRAKSSPAFVVNIFLVQDIYFGKSSGAETST